MQYKTINLNDILDKIQDKTKMQLNTYINYVRNFKETLSNDKKEVFNKMLSDRDRLLINENKLYISDINNIINNKTSHNRDNRTPEELLVSLIIHDTLEKTTIIEGLSILNEIDYNPLATKVDLTTQNSEPDLRVLFDSYYMVELEQQTSTKQYSHIYCKEHKLESLKYKSEFYNRDIYILQKAIINNEALYAAINVNEKFIATNIKMDSKTLKKDLISEKEVKYKPLIEVFQDLETPFLLEEHFNSRKLDNIINEAKNKNEQNYKKQNKYNSYEHCL